MMYTVASYMIEVLSGEQFAEFLRSRIWDPLQMPNTYHNISGMQARNATALLTHGYHWDERAEYYVNIPSIEQPEAQGAGLVSSSVNDCAKWIQASIKRTDPLPLAAHKELVKPQAIMHEEEEDRIPFYSQALYALGWVVETYRGLTVIGHDGRIPGFNSLMRYLPELEWGIVIFRNSNGAEDIAEILCWYLADGLLSVPTPERLDRTAL
jgi:CubicO group peptidase (beta-lactamase class C family)